MPTRAEYYKWAWQYERRREVMRGHQLQLTKKIKQWKKQIRIMDERTARIIALGNAIAIFMGVNIKGIGASKLNNVHLAKGLFSKYGIENGLKGNLLSEYMGHPRNHAPDVRRRFTKSFSTIPVNRDLYNRFKIYMEFLEEEAIINQENSV